jgi:hypothetical protein
MCKELLTKVAVASACPGRLIAAQGIRFLKFNPRREKRSVINQ